MTINLSIAFGCWIENAAGGAGNDTITGNDLANVCSGNGGNDVLNGGVGNDRLLGGSGADTLNGGAGTDTADFRSLGGASFNLAAGTSGGSSASDVFISIERFLGSATDGDNITGGNGKEQLSVMAGTTCSMAAAITTISRAVPAPTCCKAGRATMRSLAEKAPISSSSPTPFGAMTGPLISRTASTCFPSPQWPPIPLRISPSPAMIPLKSR